MRILSVVDDLLRMLTSRRVEVLAFVIRKVTSAASGQHQQEQHRDRPHVAPSLRVARVLSDVEMVAVAAMVGLDMRSLVRSVGSLRHAFGHGE
jgi:hypothetical protein